MSAVIPNGSKVRTKYHDGPGVIVDYDPNHDIDTPMYEVEFSAYGGEGIWLYENEFEVIEYVTENINEDNVSVMDVNQFNDTVHNPSHYQIANGVEVIDLTENLNFCRGNAIKYLARAGKKNPDKEIEDLLKAKWYVEREIDRIQRSVSG